MKRAAYLLAVLTVGTFLVIGCESSQTKAQNLFNAGRYEDVVAKYGSDPTAAPIVQQAKDKIAEKWYSEGRYQAVLDTFPSSPTAPEARTRLAEQWLNQKRYKDVIDKFPDTPSAMQARVELARMDTTNADRTAVEQPRGSAGPGDKTVVAATAAKESAANTEYQRIMDMKMKSARMKALREFVANPAYSGTSAQRKAQQELNQP